MNFLSRCGCRARSPFQRLAPVCALHILHVQFGNATQPKRETVSTRYILYKLSVPCFDRASAMAQRKSRFVSNGPSATFGDGRVR